MLTAADTGIPLIEQLHGLDVGALAPEVRAAHQVHGSRVFTGTANVERGGSWLAQLIAGAIGFPAAGCCVRVDAIKQRTAATGETWEREFAGRRFRSFLCVRNGALFETFGPFRFRLALRAHAGALHFPVAAGWLFGLPMPKWLLPRSATREYALDGCFHFDVALSVPLAGLVVRYRGFLKDHSPSGETAS